MYTRKMTIQRKHSLVWGSLRLAPINHTMAMNLILAYIAALYCIISTNLCTYQCKAPLPHIWAESGVRWWIVGESTINLTPGSGDLSLYILQFTNIQSLLTKCRRFTVGAIGADLHFAKVEIPTFPHLSRYIW